MKTKVYQSDEHKIKYDNYNAEISRYYNFISDEHSNEHFNKYIPQIY